MAYTRPAMYIVSQFDIPCFLKTNIAFFTACRVLFIVEVHTIMGYWPNSFGIRCRFSALTTIVEIYKCSDRMWRWSNVFFLISFSESSRWIWYYLGIVCCPFNVHFFHQASIWRLFVILYIGILLFFYFINFTLFEMWYILRIFYSPRNIVT